MLMRRQLVTRMAMLSRNGNRGGTRTHEAVDEQGQIPHRSGGEGVRRRRLLDAYVSYEVKKKIYFGHYQHDLKAGAKH